MRGRLLPEDADKHTVDLVRSGPEEGEHVDHEERLRHRIYSPTGREGLAPVAFVHEDTIGQAAVARGRQRRAQAGPTQTDR
ncbi:hypothetical protein DT019_32770 [Streptomyces sp. SDr-06]|nr:hypothetical protein DT019_32770 [Streptomyces sp. SDr-06]